MKTRLITYLVLSILLVTSCEKGDGEEDYGLPLIYISQATTSGGLNNDYYVPSGGGSYTHNFKIDSINNKLEVILGVTRSGKVPNKAYEVEVYTRPDTTQTIINSGVIANAQLLPEKLYQIPANVMVDDASYSEAFSLILDAIKLMDDIYTDKKLMLTVGLRNPTIYPLSEEYSNVVVIIDVNAIRAYMK